MGYIALLIFLVAPFARASDNSCLTDARLLMLQGSEFFMDELAKRAESTPEDLRQLPREHEGYSRSYYWDRNYLTEMEYSYLIHPGKMKITVESTFKPSGGSEGQATNHLHLVRTWTLLNQTNSPIFIDQMELALSDACTAVPVSTKMTTIASDGSISIISIDMIKGDGAIVKGRAF